MASRPVSSVKDRASARTCVAPAAGCFGLRLPVEGQADTPAPLPGATSDWDRFAERFAVIDYGDGRPIN